MTTVIFAVDHKKSTLYAAADSLATEGSKKCIARKKIIQHKTGPIIGGAGYAGAIFQAINLLEWHSSEKDLTEEFLTFEVGAAIKKTLKENFLVAEDQGVLDSECKTLWFSQGKLFAMYPSFIAEEVLEEYSAIGSGSAYALGAFAATEKMAMAKRVENAIRVAEHFDSYSGGYYIQLVTHNWKKGTTTEEIIPF